MAIQGMTIETYKQLVTLTAVIEKLSYFFFFALGWPYSTRKLCIATIMIQISFPAPDWVTRVVDRIANNKTRGPTKIR